MEARDLRIGNWYNWYAEGKKYQYQVKETDFCNGNIANFEPIPLSEEWLLKFGFGKVIGWFITTNPNITLEVSENNDNDSGQWYCYVRNINAIGGPDDFCLLRKDLRFVHELQNAFHALTGEELTLNQ